MPCNSDYLEASWSEVEAAKLFHMLDELKGKKVREFGDGFDKRVYCNDIPKRTRDELVREICRRMQSRDPKTLSLEAQIWWRDHQKADAKRERDEASARARTDVKRRALAKLSREERKALGL